MSTCREAIIFHRHEGGTLTITSDGLLWYDLLLPTTRLFTVLRLRDWIGLRASGGNIACYEERFAVGCASPGGKGRLFWSSTSRILTRALLSWYGFFRMASSRTEARSARPEEMMTLALGFTLRIRPAVCDL